MKATIVYACGSYPFPATAVNEPGDVIVRPDGSLAILQGFDNSVIGKMINPTPIQKTQIAEFAALSVSTWAAGAVLYWDAVANAVTTTVGTNRRVGRACEAKTVGKVLALVNCDYV